MNNINDEIIKAANTALTDRSIESDELLQPKLIVNEIENELKTLSYLVNRLDTCDEFLFSAAFLTNSGVASLYNSLKTFSNNDSLILAGVCPTSMFCSGMSISNCCFAGSAL